LFIIADVNPAPIIEPLESDVDPVHDPFIVGTAVGADGEDGVELPAQAAAPTAAASTIVSVMRMLSSTKLR
jgi:hypothetical protein